MTRKRKDTERKHLTEKRIEQLALPAERRILYDAKVSALGLKLEPSGSKTFFWFRAVPHEEQPNRAGKPTWRTIGTWPDIKLEPARAKAEEYNVLLANWRKDGCHAPSPFRGLTKELTVTGLLEAYIAQHIRAHSHHPIEAEYELRKRLAALGVQEPQKEVDRKKPPIRPVVNWSERSISTISRKDVAEVHSKIGEKHKPKANRIVEDLRAMWNFAIKAELWAGENPCEHIAFFHRPKRARFVQPAEMPLLFAAMKAKENRDLVDFISLSLWTGARKADLLSARWDKVNLDNNVWEIPDPKNRTPYVVALTPEAAAILKKRKNGSPWVFPGPGKTGHLLDLKRSWKSLVKHAGIQGLRQHDLRRTLGSWQAGLGTSLQIIGKSLGHKSVAATEIYSRLNLDPVRESVNAATQAMLTASRKKLKTPRLPQKAARG